MADVRWIKIVTDIFDDEKILLIEAMPEHDSIITIWFKLLCLAGKQNNSGVFMINDRIPYTEEMLATIFRRPINTVRLALGIFQDYGMVEVVNGAYTIPNWDKHQSLDALEAKKERDRIYQRKRREKISAITGEVRRLSDDTSGDSRSIEVDIEEDIDKSKSSVVAPTDIFFGMSDELRQAADDWIKYKAEKRQVYKPTGLKNLIAEIKNNATMYGDHAVAEVIRVSMSANYQGIVFDRLKNGRNQATGQNKTAQMLKDSYAMMDEWSQS